MPEELRWMESGSSEWNQALDTLTDYSLLTREAHGPASEDGVAEESVHMHRLVHDIVSRLTDGPHRDTYRNAVRTLLTEADPGDPADSRHWPRYAELVPHLNASAALTSRSPQTQRTVLNCLRSCEHSGKYRTGIDLAEKIRSAWGEFMNPLAQSMIDLTVREGSLLRATGRFYEAYQLDLGLRDRLGQGEPVDEVGVLVCDDAVAGDLRHLGQYTEADDLQGQALDQAQRLLGHSDLVTVTARHHLGLSRRLLGRYREAYEHDAAALARSERAFRHRHATTLRISSAVAQDLRLLGRYREALARQEATFRLHDQVLGLTHPQTLQAHAQLLLCRRRGGGTQQDIGATMETLLEQMERVHGRSHYVTLALVNDYSNLLREHGDLDRAAELAAEAESGYRSLVGPAHPFAAGTLVSTGLTMVASGQRSSGLSLLEAALIGLTGSLGPDHPLVLGCALNTSTARNLSGQTDYAAELSRDTLRRARQTLGDEHPLTLSCQTALAADLRALRQTAEAEQLDEEAFLVFTRTLGIQHPHTVAARQRARPFWDFEVPMG
ncbi:FxSxx-COOH system tetratricopeptide repeat protein [Streptomyces diastatochromogenes]|nr:FxSxx-COOH system tetratricopeptide repeat protein [Streptomyces diastatochromogenes]